MKFSRREDVFFFTIFCEADEAERYIFLILLESKFL